MGLPVHATSPTSASPRSAGPSESSEEHNSDLESLVVAALAEGGKDDKSERSNVLPNMFDPTMMKAQTNMLQMMPMMPMMPPISQMAPQLINPAAMGYGFPPFSMDPFGMVPYQVIPIQWRFQGQAMPPLTAPLTSAVRDLISLIYHRLTYERHIQASDRLTFTISANSHRLSLDEQTHGMMPLTMIGLIDPTVILDVVRPLH